MKTKALIIGSGPQAQEFYHFYKPMIDSEREDWAVMTTNRGALWLKDIDYYFASDPHEIPKYIDLFPAMRERGCKIVSPTHAIKRSPQISKYVDVEIPGAWTTETTFKRGGYPNGRKSGSFLTCFAVNNGYNRIMFIGMQGYRSNKKKQHIDYFDGTNGKPVNEVAQPIYEKLMLSIFKNTPEISYTFCGKPVYEVKSKNVKVIELDEL